MIINSNSDTTGISQLTLQQASVANTQASTSTAGTAAAQYSGTDSTPGDDSISLSNSSSLVSKLVQQALNSSSPERSARTQQLKALVQSNQYSTDAQEVSQSMVQAQLTGI